MAKFKTGFVQGFYEQQQTQQEQQRLKEKHNIENEDVVVVEKSNTFKFTVRQCKALVKLLAIIIILLLATVGLAAVLSFFMLQPESRDNILRQIVIESSEKLTLWFQIPS